MVSRRFFWLKLATVAQALTASFHVLSFFNQPKPINETEAKLFELMSSYKFDLGIGFHRSMNDLMNAFSISFTLLLVFSFLLNLFLLRNKIASQLMKGVILISTLVYFVCFISMACLTFLPPIICTGIIVVALLLSYWELRKEIHLKNEK